MKCGECLMIRTQIVELVVRVCPDCGTDYSGEDWPKGKQGELMLKGRRKTCSCAPFGPEPGLLCSKCGGVA